MVVINYPEPDFRIKKEGRKEFIFDALRKKWLLLTPEEWVRQNFLQYMILVKKYPSSLIAVEKEIELADLKKRFDIVLYKNARPWMIVECKETTVALDRKVLDQVLRYNMSLKVPYLVITNGSYCYAFAVVGNKLEEINDLPEI